MKWYAVRTKPRWEKKVADLLSSKKIECYCPVNKVPRLWSDRKKTVLEPLFTSYVFVHIDETQQTQVRATNGVVNFVYFLNKPAKIRAEEIETVKRFLNEYENIRLERVPIKPNDTVQIIGGPFIDKQGLVISITNKSAKVVLPSLGFMMLAELKTADLELASASTIAFPRNENFNSKINDVRLYNHN